jgi:hypothetical protein
MQDCGATNGGDIASQMFLLWFSCAASARV